MAKIPVVSSTTPQTPLVDQQTGQISWTWLKWFQNVAQTINTALNQAGQFVGAINASAVITGRTEGIGTTVQNINSSGVVQPAGMTAATPAAQGSVILPAGAVNNTLGTASIQPTTAFDAAGAAATAQSNAQAFATTAANTAQSNAEAFSANASNISSGTVAATFLPAISTLSGQITASQLPANVPVVSFGSGAPVGSSTEGYIYYDTSVTPYQGYVFHSSAWNKFS